MITWDLSPSLGSPIHAQQDLRNDPKWQHVIAPLISDFKNLPLVDVVLSTINYMFPKLEPKMMLLGCNRIRDALANGQINSANNGTSRTKLICRLAFSHNAPEVVADEVRCNL